MKLSRSTELAIHGLFQLAQQKQNMLLVTDIAYAQNVSTSFLSKVFQKLAQCGLVRSKRGKKGGFSLARSPKKISLADVVQAVEAKEPLFDCLGPIRGCNAKRDCLLCKTFHQAEANMYSILKKTSLQDLLTAGKNLDYPWLL